MPKKITRIQSDVETNGDASNSFVAFVGGKPQLVKYQDGFVGMDEEDLDEPLVDRILEMDGDQLRELTEAEEEQILNDSSMSFEQKVSLIQNHEDKIQRQMSHAIQIETYSKRIDEDE
jgi:hypothetical protein